MLENMYFDCGSSVAGRDVGTISEPHEMKFSNSYEVLSRRPVVLTTRPIGPT